MTKTLLDYAPTHYGARPISRIPSKFLRQVVDDVRAVMEVKGVRFRMDVWTDLRNSSCSVCVAGAVLLNRAHPSALTATPCWMSEQTELLRDAMEAINNYRMGLYSWFLKQVTGVCVDDNSMCLFRTDGEIVSYLKQHAMRLFGKVSKREMVRFCENTLQMADYLESKGF